MTLVIFLQPSYVQIADIILDLIGFGLAWSWAILIIFVTIYLGYERPCGTTYTYIDDPNHACDLARRLNGLEFASAALMLGYG